MGGRDGERGAGVAPRGGAPAAAARGSWLAGVTSFYGLTMTLPVFGLGFSMCFCYASQRLACNPMDGAFQILQYAGMVLASVLIAAGAAVTRRDVSTRPSVTVAMLALSVAVAPFVALPGPWVASPRAMAVIALADGLAVGWVCVAWGAFYARLDARQAFAGVCGMLVLSSVVKVFYDLLDNDAVGAVTLAALPVASLACLRAARATQTRGENLARDAGRADMTAGVGRYDRSTVGTLRWYLLGLAAIVVGVAMSMSVVLNVFGLPFWYRVASQALTAGIAVALPASIWRGVDQTIDSHDFGFLAVLIVASGLAAGVLFGVPLGHLSAAIFTTAQMMTIGFVWFVLSDVAHRCDAPADVPVGLIWGLVFSLPMGVGLLLPHVAPLPMDAQSISVLALWVLLVGVALMRQRQSPELRLFAGFSPRMAGGLDESATSRLASLAQGRGLTARELEVAELYAQGRSRTFISAQLVISENTVRDHLKSVYRKLGIHSKQELIDLIE